MNIHINNIKVESDTLYACEEECAKVLTGYNVDFEVNGLLCNMRIKTGEDLTMINIKKKIEYRLKEILKESD